MCVCKNIAKQIAYRDAIAKPKRPDFLKPFFIGFAKNGRTTVAVHPASPTSIGNEYAKYDRDNGRWTA